MLAIYSSCRNEVSGRIARPERFRGAPHAGHGLRATLGWERDSPTGLGVGRPERRSCPPAFPQPTPLGSFRFLRTERSPGCAVHARGRSRLAACFQFGTRADFQQAGGQRQSGGRLLVDILGGVLPEFLRRRQRLEADPRGLALRSARYDTAALERRHPPCERRHPRRHAHKAGLDILLRRPPPVHRARQWHRPSRQRGVFLDGRHRQRGRALGLVRSIPLLLAPALAAWLALLGPALAQAQTTLVSNTGQTHSAAITIGQNFDRYVGLSFTTGGNTAG